MSACSLVAKGQKADSLLNDFTLSELDSLLTQEDSLSIFSLIDSLLQMEEPVLSTQSQLALRIGYNSNAASSSRTLGISQFGLSPGASYYHKSGAYADVSGYWSTEYDPSYYLTIVSGGYVGALTRKWSFLAEYSHYFYSNLGDGVTIAYTNSFGVSNFFDVKPFTFRLDYSYLFGESSGHRVLPGVMLNLEKRNWRKIDRILFYPSFNILLGSEHYDEEILQNYSTPLEALLLIRDKKPLFTVLPEETQFGAMNYSLTAPLSVSVKNWNFLLAYTYNIPKSLPREGSTLTNSGYIAASVTKYLRFK